MKILFLVISVFLIITVTNAFGFDFLYHSDGPYKGKVIDLETGEPIEGAVVAAVWGLSSNPFTPFCDAKERLTDKNGEFVLPRGSCFSLWPFTEMDRMIVVFKPGYLGYPPLGSTPEERRARMPGFTGEEFKDRKQFNVIRLGRPKIRREREFTLDNGEVLFVVDKSYIKLPILLKLINEEGRNLGIGEIGPIK